MGSEMCIRDRPKARTKFIVEKINGGIQDYYFTSSENFDNHSLKEDIASRASSVIESMT